MNIRTFSALTSLLGLFLCSSSVTLAAPTPSRDGKRQHGPVTIIKEVDANAQYNPKELTIDKDVPWQKSKKKPGQAVSSIKPRATPTPVKSLPGKIEHPNLTVYVPETDSASTSHSKFQPDGSPIRAKVAVKPDTRSAIGASKEPAKVNLALQPETVEAKRPGRTKYSNIVLKKGSTPKPVVTTRPNTARATANLKIKEASRASFKAAPARAPKKSKDMTLKGKKILQN